MVEINNQRKAFLDMLAWSEGTDNGRQKTRNHTACHCRAESYLLDYSDHPRKLAFFTLNPKLKSTGAGRHSFFPVGGMPTASSYYRYSSEKSDAVALQQIKECKFTQD